MEKFLGRSLQLLTVMTFATAGVILPGEIQKAKIMGELNSKGISMIDEKSGSPILLSVAEKTISQLKSFENFINQKGGDLSGSITFNLDLKDYESVNIKDPFLQEKINDYINKLSSIGETTSGQILFNYSYLAHTSTGEHNCSVSFDYIEI